jgi:lipoprotein
MKRIFKISVIGLMAVSMLSVSACGKKNSEDFETKVEAAKKEE